MAGSCKDKLRCCKKLSVLAQAIRPGATLVAIHDSARPLVQADDVRKCMADALEVAKIPLLFCGFVKWQAREQRLIGEDMQETYGRIRSSASPAICNLVPKLQRTTPWTRVEILVRH